MSNSPQQILEEDRTRCLTNFASLLGYYTIGNSHGLSNSNSNGSSSLDAQSSSQPQTGAVDGNGALATAAAVATEQMKKESGGSGYRNGPGSGFTFDAGSAGRTNGGSRVVEYLYGDEDDPMGGAICSFPSLEIQLPIPEVQHHRKEKDELPPPMVNITVSNDCQDHTTSGTPQTKSRPSSMTASIPAMSASIPAMSASILDDLPTGVSVPTSPVAHSDPTEPPKPHSEEQAPIAVSLSRPTIWTRSSVHQAPPSLLRSLATSFSALVDSRVQAWTLFLLRHSLSSNTGDKENRGFLLDMLETRTSIEVVAAVTTFTVVEEGKDDLRLEVERRRKVAEEEGRNKRYQMENCDLVLPMRFDVVMDVSLQGRKLTVRFGCLGHIAATFHETTSLITYAKCEIDTKEFAFGMIEQARLVLLEAVKSAASSDPKAKAKASGQDPGHETPASTPATSNTRLVGAASTTSFSNMGRKSSFATSRSVGHNLMQSMQNLAEQRMQEQEKSGPNENMLQKKAIASASAVKMTKSSLRLSSLLTSRLDLSKSLDGTTPRSKMGGLTKKTASVVWKEGGDTIVNISNDNTPSSSMASSMASLINANIPTTALTGNTDWPDRIVKRQKIGLERPTMRRSNKSFGKPDSNDFCSVRNATFAEFGAMKQNDDGMGITPNALQKARQQAAFGLRRSGSSNNAPQGSRPGMLGAGKSMNAMNATFEKNMNSSLGMSNSRLGAGSMKNMNSSLGMSNSRPAAGSMNSWDGQNPPIGALGDLSLGKLRSQKSAQFDRMLKVIQDRNSSAKPNK